MRFQAHKSQKHSPSVKPLRMFEAHHGTIAMKPIQRSCLTQMNMFILLLKHMEARRVAVNWIKQMTDQQTIITIIVYKCNNLVAGMQ